MLNQRKEFSGIDIARLICSLLVVCIHTSPFGTNPAYRLPNFFLQSYIARIAVPYFFAVSGFFLFRKTTPEEFSMAPVWAFLRSMLRIYCLWSLLFLPLKMRRTLAASTHGLVYITISCIRDFIFVGFDHLWYLNALIVGVLIVALLLKCRRKPWQIVTLGFLLYLVGLLARNWIDWIRPTQAILPAVWRMLSLSKKVFVTTRNGIFEGVLFVSIGMLFAYQDFHFSIRHGLLGLLVSMALLLGETAHATRWGSGKVYDMYLFSLPVCFFLFYLTANVSLPSRSIYRRFRSFSALLFYLHPFVIILLEIFADTNGIEIRANSLRYLLTMAIAPALSILIIRLSETKGFQWLKALY